MIDARQAVQTAERIAAFVRRALEGSKHSGIAVAMSGGLDSTVTAALCVKGVGADSVKGYFLPEKQGPREDGEHARLAADWLGVELETHDMTQALEALGTYDFALSKLPTEKLRAATVRGAYKLVNLFSDEDAFSAGQTGGTSAVVSKASAHFKSRHRMRMVFLYFRAERDNRMVAGCANLTEKLTGIYTRFGVDDCADIMPIAGLFRTEVRLVGESLGVPEEILLKSPAPGIIPGVRDKYVYLLDMEAERLDLLLEDIESGASIEELAAKHGVSGQELERVLRAMTAARELREAPRTPEDEERER